MNLVYQLKSQYSTLFSKYRLQNDSHFVPASVMCCLSLMPEETGGHFCLLLSFSPEDTESQLQKTREERDRLCRDKDQEIADLKIAIDTMGLQYENVLNVSLQLTHEGQNKIHNFADNIYKCVFLKENVRISTIFFKGNGRSFR